MKLGYCERCGAALVEMDLQGRTREVCSECGRVAYRNPLPVAASVVLNEDREVLLVRRRFDPHAGLWCLPTGFAELEETIDEAALRELAEETGIEGRIHRLLLARSHSDGFYGDLLFVCFEVTRTGGSEAAGDDAADVRYFPIGEVPPLAFPAHDEAVEVCAALYREPWAIHDSFTRLYSDESDGLLSDALVDLIEEHADEIYERWLAVVSTDPTTRSYTRSALLGVEEAARRSLSHFCTWLLDRERSGETEAFFFDVGRRRARQAVGLEELLSALTLLRREIWTFARERQVLASPLDVYRVMELSRRTVLYFDKALYHATRGFLAGAAAG